MVYSRKKILRNPYHPVAVKKKQKGNILQGKNTTPDTIRTGKQRPPALVDVAIKAASVLRAVQPIINTSETPCFGSNSMYWQRLPSQSLSFESAEILTVQECITNSAIYRNKAIRTTGLFVQRFIDNERGRVLLQLRHPVEARSIRTNVTGSGYRLVRSQAIIPGSRRSVKPGLVRKRKQSWIGGKLPSKTSPFLQKHRRHQEANIPALLAVDVDPATPVLGDLVAGSSMIMVIGNLQDDGRLLARVVKRLEHFDTSRHVTCLNTRRQTIFKNHHRNASQTASSEGNGKQSSPIHGCGPPPYDSFV